MEPLDHSLDRTAAEKAADKPQPPNAPSFTCPKCGMVSYNTYDIEHMYCGNCHMWMRGWEQLGLPKDEYKIPVHDFNPTPEPFDPPSVTPPSSEDKYVVFKREDFYQMMGFLALPPWRDYSTGELVGAAMDCAPIASQIEIEVEKIRLQDAVVIRRQEKFASPALATYAN